MWFNHIWFLYCLQRAGYPFKKDDLTLEEWMDLGEMKQEMEGEKEKTMMAIMGMKHA